MKKTLLAISFGLLLALLSCKKDDPTDPRDKFVGTWSGYNTIDIPEAGIINQVTPVSYIFEKGVYAEQLKITQIETNEIYTAKVTGNTYQYDPYITNDYSSGFQIYWEQNGYGTVDGNHIVEYGDILFIFNTEEYTGSWSQSLDKQ